MPLPLYIYFQLHLSKPKANDRCAATHLLGRAELHLISFNCSVKISKWNRRRRDRIIIVEYERNKRENETKEILSRKKNRLPKIKLCWRKKKSLSIDV